MKAEAREDQAKPDMRSMIDELTRSRTHREGYTVQVGQTRWTRYHTAQVPALVDQLLGATPAGSGVMASMGGAAMSRPAARIEAIDTVMLIDDEAGEWIDRLGGIIPTDRYDEDTQLPIAGSGTIARLRRLHGLYASADRCTRHHGQRAKTGAWCCTAHHIEYDVRRWWHQARIITGWDSPAYRPFNTCSVCGHRGGLRINLELQAGFCVECRSIWDATQIGVLAQHIRTENALQLLISDTAAEPGA